MKTLIFYIRPILTFTMCVIFLICCFSINNTAAQTIRSYATRQAVKISSGGGVSNASMATDGDPATHSSLNQSIYIGLDNRYVEQILDFNPNPASVSTYATMISANTPITVKVEMPSTILGLMNKIEIQAITGLQQSGGSWIYTNVGTAVSGNNLLSLLSGNGSNEITITPNVAFQGIRVRVSATALLANSAGVYHAYVKVPATGNTLCNDRIDVMSGIMPVTILGVLSTTASVSNPWAAVDNDMSTYAELKTGIDVLNEVYHTTMFNTVSKIGDTLQLALQDISGNLLTVGALTGFTIRLYNGETLAQTITNNPAILSLRLLNPVGNIMQMSAVPTVAFDKAEIMVGGVANAFSGIRIYEMDRKNAGVLLTSSQKNIYVYAGQTYTLNATAIATGDNVVFYDAPVNGNVMSAGPTTTTEAQSGTMLSFYTGTTRNGCLESSERKTINIHIIGFTRHFPDTAYLGQPYNSDIIVSDTNSLPLPSDFQYTTTSQLPEGLSLNPQTGVITGMLTSMTSVPPIIVNIFDSANNLPVGTFSYPFILSVGIPLGIDNILTCKTDGNEVLLQWSADSDKEHMDFIIERSMDAKKFNTTGVVKSNYGFGTVRTEYSFTDKQPDNGINYYRLKQTEKNGKVHYSNLVSAFINTKQSVSIYPNPVNTILNIRTENTSAVYIYNAAGQLVLTKTIDGQNNTGIDVSHLANGIYSLRIGDENEILIKNFIISH
ncbi:T9SS type A sorting domain-containing protein [Taibaiella lutea]|uniref:T9SS type A sorting domain-containing protein n=1 Tax=Taibaiella lutea TaxID=2608001 RepID=A0A5M6CIA3_9BACT|nr:T9SS type A sorting domain-containing protein [Taibaiella lutea]KAA5533682.1 T9SS type A sorting domain-containing protein [Taibaiella lutea]